MADEEYLALPNAKCWKCGVEVVSKATVLCPACHAVEVEKVHARDTPPSPDWKPVCRYEPPVIRLRRPGSRGRRVLRNEKSIQ